MNTKEKTLEDVSPEAFGLIMALNEKACAKLAEPDFLPPPRRSCARRSDLFVGR